MSQTRDKMKVLVMDDFNRTCCICKEVHDLVYDLPSPAHRGTWGFFCESCRLKLMVPYNTIGSRNVSPDHELAPPQEPKLTPFERMLRSGTVGAILDNKKKK